MAFECKAAIESTYKYSFEINNPRVEWKTIIDI